MIKQKKMCQLLLKIKKWRALQALFILTFLFFVLSNTNSDLKPADKNSPKSNLSGIQMSHNPGIYSSSIDFKLTLDGSVKAEIFLINKNGTQKQGNHFLISEPSVVKIIYKDKKGISQKFIGNYIVNKKHFLPVVALYVNSEEFFPPTGIYDGTVSKDASGEIATVGKAWDKQPIPGYAQFFFNGKLSDELDLDVKTYGGMTLGWKEKSLQLSARKEKYGTGKINVKLFKNLPFREYQHVVLRTSGNDQNKTRLKDLSLSKVAQEINLNVKAYRQVVVYINGQYWGIHNLREKINDDYFKYRYNWEKDSFIQIQGSGLKNLAYQEVVTYAKNSFSNADFVQKINEKIDVENYFNFNIFQTYISNVDYRGNVRFFKPKNGKWKWIVYDTDLACGNDFNSRNFIQDRTLPKGQYWYNPSWSTSLLNSLLKNNELRGQFINQYCYLLSSYLTPENFDAKIDESVKEIEPELSTHFLRRNHIYSETISSWENNLKNLKQYFSKRKVSVYDHLIQTFGLSEPVNVTIGQNTNQFKGLKINNSSILTNKVNGLFFKELPFQIEATNSNHLYTFKTWSNGITTSKTSITPGKSASIQAIYKHVEQSAYSNKLVLKRLYVNNSFKEPLIILNLENKGEESLDLSNCTLYEDVSASSLDLKNHKILPGESYVLASDTALFKKYNKDRCKIIPFMTNIKFLDSAKFVLLQQNKWVDSLHVKIPDSLYVQHAGWLINKKNGGLTFKHVNLKKLAKVDFKNQKKSKAGKTTSYLSVFIAIFGIAVIIIIIIFWRRRMRLFMFFILLSSLNGIAQIDCDLSKKDPFSANSILTRSVDNKGQGDLRFTGTRNFRVVLPSLVYRGGGNNLHLKDTIPKYYLWNPLPIYGIKQLQAQGFSKAIYLYDYNFDYWYPKNILESLKNEGFEYSCRPKISDDFLNEFFKDVISRANDSTKGPVYIHCWNGWHQSGLLSAITLIQFCDYSNKEAIAYWERCTDGNFKGFPKVRQRISEYKINRNYVFTKVEKDKYCPCNEKIIPNTYVSHADDKVNLSEKDMMQNQNSQNLQQIHIVKKGDTLYKIAKLYNVSIESIKQNSNLKSDVIGIGQKLTIK